MFYRVFTKKGCGSCNSVKAILRSKGINFDEIDVSTEWGLRKARDLGVMRSGTIIDEDDNIVAIEDVLKAPLQAVCPV